MDDPFSYMTDQLKQLPGFSAEDDTLLVDMLSEVSSYVRGMYPEDITSQPLRLCDPLEKVHYLNLNNGSAS